MQNYYIFRKLYHVLTIIVQFSGIFNFFVPKQAKYRLG